LLDRLITLNDQRDRIERQIDEVFKQLLESHNRRNT